MTVLPPLPAATVPPAVAPGAPEVEPPPSAPSGASTATIEWLAECFDVGLAAMAMALADQAGNAGPSSWMTLGYGR